MTSFGPAYVALYDMLYSDKPYEAEAARLADLIRAESPDARRVVDYGTGTGRYAQLLSAHGFEVVGVEPNPHMLALARARDTTAQFLPLAERDQVEGSDVVCALFDVVSYMTDNSTLLDFLRWAHSRLPFHGLLIFDCWYGPAVQTQGPERRWKEVTQKDRHLLRLTSPEHRRDDCTVLIRHRVLSWERDRVLGDFTEEHLLRYFFAHELRLLLENAGFALSTLGTLQAPTTPPTVGNWSTLVTAHRR
ncbi:MAG: hypothetical protein A2289_13145 [Deltaproteobacteria bacterium RIFOXYA12_FULL_58_15]|nr:MAG: hypothetical protein A2289_13145 [Deltaproteobacteria bacterium RIFOXYA12_FULL_58_15]OGR09437.1 MAG: hypothetical protein A2341_18135 [Deltaproteobacteria bacterium RIFOXYB12_FULL_58_9]